MENGVCPVRGRAHHKLAAIKLITTVLCALLNHPHPSGDQGWLMFPPRQCTGLHSSPQPDNAPDNGVPGANGRTCEEFDLPRCLTGKLGFDACRTNQTVTCEDFWRLVKLSRPKLARVLLQQSNRHRNFMFRTPHRVDMQHNPQCILSTLGIKPIFGCITQPFVNRFQRAVCQDDGRAAFELAGDKLTCGMSILLFTGASKRLQTRLLTITRPFLNRF
jgi:hypothetical protein